ncbi:lytic transglycosylase [Geomonas limicola]|uniref:Lytic transglycosylase n=1 Tax=Geomonas limicola TaxID=2740186 RepID=A0A6V8N7F6_9BACT|nr:transglycosylase SLT domain-containing protein [Geomonas limicola]GFO68300.1 lytic transglycosylase [Geomonas limicola]
MKRTIVSLVAVLFLSTSCDQSHMQQTQAPLQPGLSPWDRDLIARESEEKSNATGPARQPVQVQPFQDDDAVEVRRKQIPAISATFARRTTPERAQWLAELCFKKTIGTTLTPLDLAEIALAETGGHRLSSRAVSPRGALGVWQLMPERARSHGFHPSEMRDDEKCADAAVRELKEKLTMAGGNLSKAKRYYCGTGPAAAAYDKLRKRFRAEILRELEKGFQERGLLVQAASHG